MVIPKLVTLIIMLSYFLRHRQLRETIFRNAKAFLSDLF
jgi:hypothetical protein